MHRASRPSAQRKLTAVGRVAASVADRGVEPGVGRDLRPSPAPRHRRRRRRSTARRAPASWRWHARHRRALRAGDHQLVRQTRLIDDLDRAAVRGRARSSASAGRRRSRRLRNRPQHPSGDCVEPGEHGRVAPLGRGDQRVIEGVRWQPCRHGPSCATATAQHAGQAPSPFPRWRAEHRRSSRP